LAQTSVVICAHSEKRWDAVLAAVQSVRDQSKPAGEIFVVVDHNPRLHDRLKSALPDVTVVENNEERGLSGGRNTGVHLATGDIVAFLDDDAVADTQWLKYLNNAYTDPTVAGVGGLTLPRWQSKRPSWFPPEFDWVIGCTYVGVPKFSAPVRNLLGGNASFRRKIFATVGGFRNGLGRSMSKLPLGCEETELCIRLSQQQPEVVMLFEPRAVIWHLIPASRCKVSYFCIRCYAEGISKSYVTASVGFSDGLATERRYVSRTLPLGIVRGFLDFVRGRPSGLARSAMIIVGFSATSAGYVVGSLRRVTRPVKFQDSVHVAGSVGSFK
jgi:glucosyl-dolichyl phosphate glucuronosyltransferase